MFHKSSADKNHNKHYITQGDENMQKSLSNTMSYKNTTVPKSTQNDTIVMGDTEIADIKHTEQMLKDGVFNAPEKEWQS